MKVNELNGNRTASVDVTGAIKEEHSGDDAPVLEMTPGMRILAKLQTEISSADPTPVVAVVEYTYAIGDQVVVPAGAQISGQLQHVDRSGYVGVKFDEIQLLGGRKEKIDAVGKGLDLGPIRGTVTGRTQGRIFSSGLPLELARSPRCW
jgi:hypothetical protein